MEDFNCSSSGGGGGDIKDETLWRSIESDSDNPNDDDDDGDETVFFDLTSNDESFFDTKSSIGSCKDVIIEPELLNAMRTLQLESAKKLKYGSESKFSVDSEQILASQEINNFQTENPQKVKKEIIISQEAESIFKAEEIIPKETNNNVDNEQINSTSETQSISEEPDKNSKIEEITLKEAEENSQDREIIPKEKSIEIDKKKKEEKNIKNSVKKTECLAKVEGFKKIENKYQRVPFVVTTSMAKAMKPLTTKQQPLKKPTISITSRSSSSSVKSLIKPPETTTTTLKRQSSNVSSVSDKSSSAAASRKKNPTKSTNNIVSTITSTKDGIKLQEEKINNFSIPVTINRKKRTQFVPFSFSTRNKNKIEPNDKKIENSSKANLTIKKNVLGGGDKILSNKENKCIKSKRASLVPPPKVSAKKSIQDKGESDAKIKARQSEIIIGKISSQKVEEKKNIELKKNHLVTKTRVMPSLKAPLSTAASSSSSSRPKKVLTASQRV